MNAKLQRFIKNQNDEKVELHVTSVNIEQDRHVKFLKKNNLNLSSLIRAHLDDLIAEDENQTKAV